MITINITEDLLDSILEENTQGTYIEVLTFLLTNLFSFIVSTQFKYLRIT